MMDTARAGTIMTDKLQSLLRLQTWLSPAFPTGSFAYSHGLEAAIEEQLITDSEGVFQWLKALLHEGSGWNDGVLFSQSWQAGKANDTMRIQEINDLALAMQPSKERWLETTQQGKAFYDAASVWENSNLEIFNNAEISLPVIAGVLFGASNIDKTSSIATYLNSFTSNLVWVCVRLIPIGQSDGLKIIVELEDEIISVAEKISQSSLDDLGTCSLVFDIASMAHEDMTTRIYRT